MAAFTFKLELADGTPAADAQSRSTGLAAPGTQPRLAKAGGLVLSRRSPVVLTTTRLVVENMAQRASGSRRLTVGDCL
jgi:hypothetical protein